MTLLDLRGVNLFDLMVLVGAEGLANDSFHGGVS
jgi:hypothetical protein